MLAVVQLIIAIFVFAVILLGAVYFLWLVVTKDSIKHDMEHLWENQFTYDEIDFPDRADK